MSTRWYALNKNAQYRAAILNIDGILYLKEKEGWEIGAPFDTEEDADAYLREWKDKDIRVAENKRR
jgi:hypothetical protein